MFVLGFVFLFPFKMPCLYKTNNICQIMTVRLTGSLLMQHKEQHKGSTKELQPLQPVSQLHRGPNLNSSMQMQIAWEINKRS